MQHLDEGTVHAWLDGALSVPEAARVEEHVAECAECAEVVAGARGMIAASSRILSALDDVPGGVVPASTAASGSWASRAFRNTTLRVAASIVLLAGGAAVVQRYTGTDATLSVETTADQQAVPVAVSTDTQESESSQRVAAKQAEADASSSPASIVRAPEPARTAATAGRGGASRQVTPRTTPDSRRDEASAADEFESPARRREVAQAAPPPSPQIAAQSRAELSVSPLAERDLSATDSTSLRLLDSSTVVAQGSAAQRLRYEVRPGVIVTLEESRGQPSRDAAAQKLGAVSGAIAREEERKNAAQLAPTVGAAASPVVNSINWIDRDGVNRMLSGALPVAELEKIRQRIVRVRVP